MAQQPGILRIVTFVPTTFGSSVDAALREIRAGLEAKAGVVDVKVGRRQTAMSDRAIVSRWTSFEDMTAALGDDAGTVATELIDVPIASDVGVTVRPVAFTVDGSVATEPVVLRVFHGTVQPGELAAYVEEAQAGTYEDVAADRGPASLTLAVDPPDRFITVSLWDGWDRLSAATGGNMRQPLMTRHAHRLAGWTAHHYEVVPADVPDAAAARMTPRLA